MNLLGFYGDPEGYRNFFNRLFNRTMSESTFQIYYSILTKTYWTLYMNFGVGISKAIGFPLGLLLQILTVIFLVRGSTGFSPSAKRWFLLIVAADIAGTLYRTYDMVTENFQYANPNTLTGPVLELMHLMWGLRELEHKFIQNVMCRVFFIIISFPLYLSPIALTMSSMIRCYCVKYPLVAKFKLTKKLDLGLILLASFLALAIAMVLGGLAIEGFSNSRQYTRLGVQLYFGDCSVPKYLATNTDKELTKVGFYFMLIVVFFICFMNILSGVIIIIVLFQSKRDRVLLSSSGNEGRDGANQEARATARLLGMNVTLLLCFFFSRLLLVVSTQVKDGENPILYIVYDQISALLFNIPYFTNSLFIAGLSSRFYRFLFPCFEWTKLKLWSSDSQKTF